VVDLLARINHPGPERVVDAGCGPGNSTELVAARWPDAHVLGIDSSVEMIESAGERARPGRLEFWLADLREWEPEQPVDVLLSNAMLHWIPEHRELLPRLAGFLAPGGVLGFEIPSPGPGSPKHIADELAESPAWDPLLGGVLELTVSHEPAEYLVTLADAGLDADAWETTYTFVLDGLDGVVSYDSGSFLRPVLARLGPKDAQRFLGEYASRIAAAFPPVSLGGRTVQMRPNRRIFAVGREPGLE
jgi:trans-aconitate 2-methyltransferase